MSKFNRAMIITSVCMIICLLIVFYAIFSVLSSSIEKLIIQDFANDAYMNYMILDTNIDKCKNGITSMESRTAIKLKTLDYIDGKIEIEALSKYVEDRYIEGVFAIDNLIIAERYLPDKMLLCGVEADNEKDYRIKHIELDVDEDYYNCVQTEDGLTLYISLNVLMQNDGVYGYEYLVFDMTEGMGKLNTFEITSNIKNTMAVDEIIYKSNKVYEDEALKVYFDGEEYYAVSKVTEYDYLVSQSTKNIIFAEYYENIDGLILSALLAFVAIFIVFYYIMFKTSKKYLSQAHKRGDNYKELAHTDLLTDCYNRAYLQYWDTNIRKKDKEYLVLVVDINKLKYINDNYGHVEGDKAICLVARSFKESLREEDAIIRLGGDEFLVLVDDIDHNIAYYIIQRAISNLKKSIEDIGFEIEFSKGYSILLKDSDLTEAIEQADKLMYQDKKNKHFE